MADDDIALQSSVSAADQLGDAALLPSSPSMAASDVTIELPFVATSCFLAVQAKRAVSIQNALVAAKLAHVAIDALIDAIQQHGSGREQAVAAEEFVEIVSSLPGLRTGEACKPAQDVLVRVHKSFQTAERTDVFHLGIACLPLIHGSIRDKLEAAVELSMRSSGTETDSAITQNVVSRAFYALLLSISALFEEESTTVETLQATISILEECANETSKHIFADLGIEADATIEFNRFWVWVDKHMNKALPWLRLLEQTKWPRCKRLTTPTGSAAGSPRHSNGHASAPPSAANAEEEYDEEYEEEEEEADGLLFRFSGVDGGVLQLCDGEGQRLFDLLVRTALTRVPPDLMYEMFERHTADGMLEEDSFIDAVQTLVLLTGKPHLKQSNEFLEVMLDLFKAFLPDKRLKADAYEIAAAFSLFSLGSKSDKLAAAFQFFDAEGKGFLNHEQLWRFLRSVLIVLLFLSPPDDAVMQRYGSLAELVDTGEEEIMENVAEGILDIITDEADEETKSGERPRVSSRHRTSSEARVQGYAFEDFGAWYNAGGFRGMSWLELLDLRKWSFVSPSFQVEDLETEIVDPTELPTQPQHTEEPDEYSEYSQSSQISTSKPFHFVKDEVQLMFELSFDGDENAEVLIFDNGDLVLYHELQRITQFKDVPLSRVEEVFGPFMKSSSSAWIEKSTFDTCVKTLLPPDIAPGIGAAFSVHSHYSAITPGSSELEKDCKIAADMLSRLFFAFNRGGTGKIDLVEFLTAFTIFFAGSKSTKLAFAYQFFDTDKDGCLKRREMWKFLRSYLTILLALGSASNCSAEDIGTVADQAAIEITDAIFRDTNKTFSVRVDTTSNRTTTRHSIDVPESADTVVATAGHRRGAYEHRGSLPGQNTVSLAGGAASAAGPGAAQAFMKGGVVAFQEFAQWYSSYGHAIMAWIELLDSKKWPTVPKNVYEGILGIFRANPRAESLAISAERASLDGGWQPSGPNGGAHWDADRGWVHPGTEAPPESKGKDLSSVALLFKLTTFDNTTLRIRLRDVAIVYTISERMTFSSMLSEDLLHTFNDYAQGKCLTREGFLRVMRRLVPRDQLTNEEQEFLSFHLLRIFALFEAESVVEEDEGDEEDSESTQVSEDSSRDIKRTCSVDKLHLLAGMCIFCGASKSQKLRVLFRQYDQQRKGRVTRRHLFELLRSVLVVLFAFSGFNATKTHTKDTSTDAWSINTAAERAAGAVISKIFCEVKSKSPDAISLDEFADWYAQGGYMDCPWLELLDLSKWPAKEAFEASKNDKMWANVFEKDDEPFLNFSSNDVATYLFMLHSTKLDEISVSKIYDALLQYATPSALEDERKKKSQMNTDVNAVFPFPIDEDEGAYLVMTRSNFYECIRSLVPKEGMTEKAQQTSSKLLSRIFNMYDRKRSGTVNVLELACGLCILGKGGKSQKLPLSFEFILKMRQQRTRTLGQFASNNPGFGTGFGAGVASVTGYTSIRGPLSTATGMRRPMLQNDQSLPASVVYIYLRSIFLAVMSLNDSSYRLGLEKIYVEADEVIEEALGDLMTDVAARGNNGGVQGSTLGRTRARVTFEQLSEWYNTGGYELISWLEFVDTVKWQQYLDINQQAAVLTATANGRVNTAHAPLMMSRRGANYPSSIASGRPVEPIKTVTQSTRRTNRRKEIRPTEIVSTSYPHGVHSNERIIKNDTLLSDVPDLPGLSTEGPMMVFAVAQGAAELDIFGHDINRFRSFLNQTQLHSIAAWDLCATVRDLLQLKKGSSAEPVMRDRFVQVVHDTCLSRVGGNFDLDEEALDLLQTLLDAFVKEPNSVTSANEGRGDFEDEDDPSLNMVDFGSALSGMLVTCGGSMLEKLKCGSQLFDEKLEDHAVVVKVETLQHCLMCFLMSIYAITSSMTAEMKRCSALLGAEEILQTYEISQSEQQRQLSPTKQKSERTPLDLTKTISLRDFSEWYTEYGYRTHPWLELAELQHWLLALNTGGGASNMESAPRTT
ncbi:TPA: hypothetical protein N0F65_000205 [Lagenidium giganteum]|uniref:EF-hand domain-containing protein n=1 Tax=Lagenidium giganteum TaxID=4803 RepID=A0AAV2YF48_9STRA|nr:TPA: hypothetical protein N0F65_000205 [Lagenidium giganteum]